MQILLSDAILASQITFIITYIDKQKNNFLK